MEEIKTKGLILSSNNLNDNDKIFTVMTRELGKITAVSKGVRSHKHKDFAALQPFCYSDMVLSRKTGLYYVSSAGVIENFFGIRRSVEQMSVAAYIVDIIKNIPDDSPLDDECFSFVLNTLYLIGMAEEKCTDGDVAQYLKRLKAVFEIKIVCSEGFTPYIDGCVQCGCAKNLDYFDFARDAVICEGCRTTSPSGDDIKITPLTLKLLRFIIKSGYKQVFAFNAPDTELNIISHIAEQYLINCLEIYPPSLSYLKKMFSGEKSV